MRRPDFGTRALAESFADPWHGLTAFSLALFTIMALWAATGEVRAIDGEAVWAKPLKFALSFAVLFATIGLVAGRLSDRVRTGWPLGLIGVGMALAMIAEMGWITVQAARERDSHFNLETPLEAFMYNAVMAAGAVYLVVAVGLIGWIAYRDREARMGPALREGVWLGFLASFLLTLLIAGFMSMGTSPYSGTHGSDDPVLPVLGWSGVTGDFRPAHFLALHAMQAIPLLGLWLDRRGQGNGVRTVRFAAIGWSAATLLLFAQALAGWPVIPLR